MGMMIRPGVFSLATLLSWLAGGAVCAQTFQTNLTYVCGGERMIIESCSIRDVSDNSSCLVQHPDRPQHNGFPAYTNETRGALKQLVPTCQQPSADAVARELARQKKQNDQQDAAMKKALAPASVPLAVPNVLPNAVSNTLPNAVPNAVPNRTPLAAANRDLVRCLESGRSQSQCGSSGSADPISAMVNALQPADKEEKKPAGIYALGTFRDPSGVTLAFSERSIQLTGCGTLLSASLGFTVSMKGNQALLNVGNSPQPFVLAFRPDGRLAGPGPVSITGQIVTGSRQEYYIPAPSAANLSPQGYYRTVDAYGSRTERCTIGVLTATGPVTESTGGDLLSVFSSAQQKTFPAGLRMQGEYFAAGGFSIRFYPETAVLRCGESSDTQNYSVENTGSQTLLRIQNGAAPVVLNFRSDGTLAGTGQVLVNGRRLVGRGGNGAVSFAPRPATCAVGVLAPGSLPAAPPPADGSQNAVLTVSVGFATAKGLFVPVAGANVSLLRKNLESTLKEIGFQPRAGQLGGGALPKLR